MLLLFSLFCLIRFISTVDQDNDHEILLSVHRILYKRDIASNIALDDPKSKCRNGGIYSGGRCHCIHPHVGKQCEHFDCAHGISVGFRYDPESLIFGAPCICNEGWKGELCNYKPADKCGGRGEWKNNRCECIGFYFGSECQYTSRCIEGSMKHGRCICNEGFEGDYCDRIICDYGTPNFHNRSMSCICPEKYTGRHCNRCRKSGLLVEPYPVCTVSLSGKKTIEHAMELRKKQKKEMRKRIWIVSMCIFVLSIAAAIAFCANMIHRNSRKEERDRGKKMKEERHRLLTNQVRLQKYEENVAKESNDNHEAESNEERKRRKSEPNLFRVKRPANCSSNDDLENIIKAHQENVKEV